MIALVDNLVKNKAVIPEITSYYDVVESVDDELLLGYFKKIKG